MISPKDIKYERDLTTGTQSKKFEMEEMCQINLTKDIKDGRDHSNRSQTDIKDGRNLSNQSQPDIKNGRNL